MKTKYSILLVLAGALILGNDTAWSQSTAPRPMIGKPMPDFTLNHVSNFEKSTVSLNDFRGKWLFLDFWSLGCSVCIKKFGGNNEISNALKDKLVWLNVGINSRRFNNGIETFYNKLAAYKSISMPAAFDSTLEKSLGVENTPYIFMIDPKGILYGISNGTDFTQEKIASLVNGEPVRFNFRTLVRPKFDPLKSIRDVDSTLLIRYSVLSKWNGEDQDSYSSIDFALAENSSTVSTEITESMVPIFYLYDLAFFGKAYWDGSDSLYHRAYRMPVLEIRDPSRFDYSYEADLGKGLYNYQMKLPYKASRETCMKVLRQDLLNAFGYSAAIEKRPIPVWKLVCLPGAEKKLRTRGGTSKYPPRQFAAGFEMRNVTPSSIAGYLATYVNGEADLSIIDATNIQWPIDFSIWGDLTSIEGIQEALKSTPLRLERGTLDLDVVVIRDGDPEKLK